MDLFKGYKVNGKRIPKDLSIYIADLAGYKRCASCDILYGPKHLSYYRPVATCWECACGTKLWPAFQLSYAELYDVVVSDCTHFPVAFMPEWAVRNEIWTIPNYLQILICFKTVSRMPEEYLPLDYIERVISKVMYLEVLEELLE